ncbi:Hypothetical predicted protein [Pelobates cultripes]|uniref:Uncharacterized protein n=1 Tax=Pelobates cultripes TaxID=61616 RepID=A0AAD1VKI5_PELCU|nr:Hypothetical predicted protein [Pelobates cultripes]
MRKVAEEEVAFHPADILLNRTDLSISRYKKMVSRHLLTAAKLLIPTETAANVPRLALESGKDQTSGSQNSGSKWKAGETRRDLEDVDVLSVQPGRVWKPTRRVMGDVEDLG